MNLFLFKMCIFFFFFVDYANAQKKNVFKITKVEGRYCLEIGRNNLNDSFCIVSRLVSKKGVAAPEFYVYSPGWLVNNSVIGFTKDLKKKRVFIGEIGGNKDNERRAKLPLVIIRRTQEYLLLDIDNLLKGINNPLFFDKPNLASLGTFVQDSSFIEYVHSGTKKIDLFATKYFEGSGPIKIHTVVYLLPKTTPDQIRVLSEGVGYFTITDSTLGNPILVNQGNTIIRWNLRPRIKDLNKYIDNDLVEPESPIQYLVDPISTPPKWIPYIIKGIEDWKPAFESAGFKNAIIGRIAPIIKDKYFVLPEKNAAAIIFQKDINNEDAYYSTIADNRTGNIVQSYILWNPGTIDYFLKAYLTQVAGPHSLRNLNDSIIGNLIRMVIAHEVGHSLGLTHNFMASHSIPVDSLKCKKWLQKNGFSNSIMDYSYFNFVAQDTDSIIFMKGILNSIGKFDRSAINWGYRYFKDTTEEARHLNVLIDSMQMSNELSFDFHERCNSRANDLGNNQLISSSYGIKNLKRNVDLLFDGLKENEQNKLDKYLPHFFIQYTQYLRNVSNDLLCFDVINEPIQSRISNVIQFYKKVLFSEPEWLTNNRLKDSMDHKKKWIEEFLINSFLTVLSDEVIVALFEIDNAKKGYWARQYLTEFRTELLNSVKVCGKLSFYQKKILVSYNSVFQQLFQQSSNNKIINEKIREIISNELDKIKTSLEVFKENNLLNE